MKEKAKKLTISDFNSGKTEKFEAVFKDGKSKISVELYKDLGIYFVDYVNEKNNEDSHTYSFGSLSQARSVFNDKVKISKFKIKEEV